MSHMELHKDSNQNDQLWVDFQNGSEQAFTEIYNAFFRLLYNYGCKFTSDKDLVKDAIHDLFVKLWEKRCDVNIVTSLKYYLLKAMRHKMLDALEKKKKLSLGQENLSESHFEFVLPYESLLISHQLSQEQQARLLRAVNLLTPRQKEAIFLRYYNSMSYEEIAALMSLSVDSCYNLISKALHLIKIDIVKIALGLLLLCA